MRDHTKLRAFELADQLALSVYQATSGFPRAEMFGPTAQLRRGAVSVASNIVEGCARSSEAEYLHFLDMAYGSARRLPPQNHFQLRRVAEEPLNFVPRYQDVPEGSGRPDQAPENEPPDALVADPQHARGFLDAEGKPGGLRFALCLFCRVHGVVDGDEPATQLPV